MGKSAKTTRGGNKHRVNVVRQKAKLAAAGIKDHTAYDAAAAAAISAQKLRREQQSQGTDAATNSSGNNNARDAVKKQMADSLAAIRRQREAQQAKTTSVKMAPRPKKSSAGSA